MPTIGEDGRLEPFQAAITSVFPELSGARFRLLAAGWDSTAVDVDDRLIFKFPKDEAAAQALLREARLLAVLRPALSMPVPDLAIHRGPPLFSRHRKLPGEHLLPATYEALPAAARRRIGLALARFYAELHALERDALTAAGAGPIKPWLPAEVIAAKALPLLSAPARAAGERIVTAFPDLPPDPHGTVYGFFDGHGWNMAFDPGRQELNGIFDFADSGFGALHQDFIYSNLISRDLTQRIVAGYESLTGRALDRRRIALLTGVHRLSELAELADDPAHRATMIRFAEAWLREG